MTSEKGAAKGAAAPESTTETPRWSSTDTIACGLIALAGFIARAVYTIGTDAGPYDPWRHLLLFRNLREGLGFTLFDGQPYLWYPPVWHAFAHALSSVMSPLWLACFLSAACVPAVYVWVHAEARHARIPATLAAALAAAALATYGPAVRFTCHIGPEAFGLAMFLLGLACARGFNGPRGAVASWIPIALAGPFVALGLVARLNFVLLAPLFLPLLRQPRRAGWVLGSTAVALALTWWRNASILAEHAWVFTWDGLASDASTFDALSTLVIQRHPDVAGGLARLHETIIPTAEWIEVPRLGVALAIGLLGVLLSRHVALILGVGLATFYFVVLDGTGTAQFFRIWLALFPAMFAGVGLAVARYTPRGRTGPSRIGVIAGATLVAVFTLLGAPEWRPTQGAVPNLREDRSISLQAATPPQGLLQEPAYFVNSGLFHPESIAWAYPRLEILGLPLEPASIERYFAAYPDVRHVLWHDFSVQGPVLDDLLRSGRCQPIREGRNAAGLRYRVLECAPVVASSAPAEAGLDDPSARSRTD